MIKKGMISVLSALAGLMAGVVMTGRRMGGQIEEKQKKADKHMSLYLMMNQWVKVKQEGKNLSSYFEREGYKNLAIYGMSYAGETLLEEFRDSEVAVAYAIDRNADGIYTDVDVVSMEDELAPVDAVVVTAIAFFDEIEEKLSEKLDCPILSLEDILYEV